MKNNGEHKDLCKDNQWLKHDCNSRIDAKSRALPNMLTWSINTTWIVLKN